VHLSCGPLSAGKLGSTWPNLAQLGQLQSRLKEGQLFFLTSLISPTIKNANSLKYLTHSHTLRNTQSLSLPIPFLGFPFSFSSRELPSSLLSLLATSCWPLLIFAPSLRPTLATRDCLRECRGNAVEMPWKSSRSPEEEFQKLNLFQQCFQQLPSGSLETETLIETCLRAAQSSGQASNWAQESSLTFAQGKHDCLPADSLSHGPSGARWSCASAELCAHLSLQSAAHSLPLTVCRAQSVVCSLQATLGRRAQSAEANHGRAINKRNGANLSPLRAALVANCPPAELGDLWEPSPRELGSQADPKEERKLPKWFPNSWQMISRQSTTDFGHFGATLGPLCSHLEA